MKNWATQNKTETKSVSSNVQWEVQWKSIFGNLFHKIIRQIFSGGYPKPLFFYFIFLLLLLLLLLLFRAASTAYGSSPVRDWIGATAVGLRNSHSNAGSQQRLRPTLHFTAMQDPHPLSEARDQTHILMNTSQIRFHCTTMGTLNFSFLNKNWSPRSTCILWLELII